MVGMVNFCVSRFDLQLYMFESYSNKVSLLTSENDISNALKYEKETKFILSAIEGEFDIESFKFNSKDSLVFKFGGSQKGMIFVLNLAVLVLRQNLKIQSKNLPSSSRVTFLVVVFTLRQRNTSITRTLGIQRKSLFWKKMEPH